MLEFPDDDIPSYTSNVIYELMQRGIIPVIVHPERNTKIMKQPDILYDLLNKGCLSQITAGSYVGIFGHKVQKFSKQLIQSGQVYIFASDAHNLPNRKYEMTNAFAKLGNEFGNDYVSRFSENAKRIINGDNILPNNFSKIKTHLFHFLNKGGDVYFMQTERRSGDPKYGHPMTDNVVVVNKERVERRFFYIFQKILIYY